MNDQAYLDTLLRRIVLYPEQMRLQRSEDARGILFRIHLAKSDMSLVIGKAGQSIHAIRWLMKLYAKSGPNISLILEEPGKLNRMDQSMEIIHDELSPVGCSSKKADDDEQLACSRMIEFARKYVKLLCAREVVPGRPVF